MRFFCLFLIAASFAGAQEPRTISLRTLCFKCVDGLKEVMLMTASPENPVPQTVPPGKIERIPIATSVNELNQATVRVYVPIGGEQKWRAVSSTTRRALPNLRSNGRTSVNCYQETPL